jgi:hypothetical protein
MGKKEKKIVEQWCFSNGEKCEKLLNSGVSTMGKRGVVFHKMKLGFS